MHPVVGALLPVEVEVAEACCCCAEGANEATQRCCCQDDEADGGHQDQADCAGACAEAMCQCVVPGAMLVFAIFEPAVMSFSARGTHECLRMEEEDASGVMSEIFKPPR